MIIPNLCGAVPKTNEDYWLSASYSVVCIRFTKIDLDNQNHQTINEEVLFCGGDTSLFMPCCIENGCCFSKFESEQCWTVLSTIIVK